MHNECERVLCDAGGLLVLISTCEKTGVKLHNALSSRLILTGVLTREFERTPTAVLGTCDTFTSIAQKLFFHIWTCGDVEKMLPPKELMTEMQTWATCGFSILVAPVSQNAFQQPLKSTRLCSVRCSWWCYRCFLKSLLCGQFQNGPALSFPTVERWVNTCIMFYISWYALHWPPGEFLDWGGRKRRGSTGVEGGWRLWALWWSTSDPVVTLWCGASSLTLRPGQHRVESRLWLFVSGLRFLRLKISVPMERDVYTLQVFLRPFHAHFVSSPTKPNHRSAWLTVPRRSINDSCLHKHSLAYCGHPSHCSDPDQ